MAEIAIPSRLRVVAVQNYGPSGTLFLQSLLDNHPSVLTTPALNSLSYYDFWEFHRGLPLDHLVEGFLSWHEGWFVPELADAANGLRSLGDGMNETATVDRTVFADAMKEMAGRYGASYGGDTGPRKLLFIAAQVAYATSLKRRVHDDMTIVFPIHSLPLREAGYFLEDFPEARFIHMVRDPVNSVASLAKHVFANRSPFHPLTCAVSQIVTDVVKHTGISYALHGDRPHFEKARTQARAVRLEDLHKRQKETLTSICEWLGLTWSDTLLASTFDGKKWWNRLESPRVSGSSKEVVSSDRYGGSFFAMDKWRLQVLLAPKYRVWGYELPPGRVSLLARLFVPLFLILPFKLGVKSFFEYYRYRFQYGQLPRRTYYRLHVCLSRLNRALFPGFSERLVGRYLHHGDTIKTPGLFRTAATFYALFSIHPAALYYLFGQAGKKRIGAASLFRAYDRSVLLRFLFGRVGTRGAAAAASSPAPRANSIRFLRWAVILPGEILRPFIYLPISIFDYLEIRWCLLRGWWDQWRTRRAEVAPLEFRSSV